MASEKLPKVVWITGASSGIGRALAQRLAGDGMSVAASARSERDLADLVAQYPGGRIAAYPLDVTRQDSVGAGVAAIESELGPIDLAILNAGTHRPMTAENFSADVARDLMAVNYMGVAHALASILPRFRARGAGHIAVVASVAGYVGLPTAAAYGPTKAALINLCEALQRDCLAHGIKLQLINPGFVRTPLTERNTFPMPFLMDAKEAADRICTGLASDRFEIAFPRRLAWLLKLARLLPYRAYFAAVGSATGL
jgi:NAD(P)-dependent dehydrogenase (short-subunit alcohol dehydrogenase family)